MHFSDFLHTHGEVFIFVFVFNCLGCLPGSYSEVLVTPTLPNFPISFPIQLIRLLTNWANWLLGKYVVSRKPEVHCRISGACFECVKVCKNFKRNWGVEKLGVWKKQKEDRGETCAPESDF